VSSSGILEAEWGKEVQAGEVSIGKRAGQEVAGILSAKFFFLFSLEKSKLASS
jgi:hypothetical protein